MSYWTTIDTATGSVFRYNNIVTTDDGWNVPARASTNRNLILPAHRVGRAEDFKYGA